MCKPSTIADSHCDILHAMQRQRRQARYWVQSAESWCKQLQVDARQTEATHDIFPSGHPQSHSLKFIEITFEVKELAWSRDVYNKLD